MLTETDLRVAGDRCGGIGHLVAEVYAEVNAYEVVDEVTRRRELRQLAMLKGALWFASSLLVEELFEEHQRCTDAALCGEQWHWQSEPVCGGLPPRYGEHYTPRFVRQLILAVGAVTARLTGDWDAPASVIEELATRLLLDQVQVVLDDNEIPVEDGWREALEELLFDDLDVDLLYEDLADEAAGILLEGVAEHYLPTGWGVPFTPDTNHAPYTADPGA